MADNQKVTFGTVPDLQIYHDTTGPNSHIETTSGSAGDLYITAKGTGHDLFLQAADDIFIQPQGSENGIKVIGDGAVELYHNSAKKIETTGSGIEITGSTIAIDSGAAGNSQHGTIIADATYGLRLRGSVSGTNSEKGGIYVQQSVVRFPGEVIGVSSPNPDITMLQINRTIGGSGGNVLTVGDPTSFGLGYKANSVFRGDVDIKGNLEVDGGVDIKGFSFNNVSKNITVANGFQDMFSITLNGPAVIADILAACGASGTNSGRQSMAYKVAQGGANAGSANAVVYNKIIDTGGDAFELQFSGIGSGNTFGFKCQAKALNDTRVINLSIQYKSGPTFADLT